METAPSPSSDDSELRGTAQRAVGLLTFGYFVGFAGVVVYGPVAAEFERALGLSGILLGLLVAAPQLTGSLLRIPFSAWADSVGAKKPFSILLGLSAVGMGGLLVVLMTAYPDGLTIWHYPLIFLFGSLSGCGIAAFSVGSTDTAYWYRSDKRGTMLAAFAGFGTTSPGLFTIVAPIALLTLGLTGTYVAWFLFLVVGTVLFVVFAVDSPYFQYRKQGHTPAESKARAKEHGQELFPSGDALTSIRRATSINRSWMLTAMFFVSFGGYLALTVWYPSYWHNLHGVDLRTASIITALTFTLSSPLFRVCRGAISDRIGGERTAIASFGMVVCSTAVLMSTYNFTAAIAATVMLGAGMGIASAAIFQLLPIYVPQAVGGASGLVGGLGAFGGFVVPPILGYVVDLQGVSGYASGFVVYVLLGVVALGLAGHLYIADETATPTRSPVPGDD